MKKIKKKNAKKRVIIEINEELDRDVDHALEIVERGGVLTRGGYLKHIMTVSLLLRPISRC